MQEGTPYWRLSTYYFVYFAALGAFVPYWSLFLQQRGFDAGAIGRLMAIVALTKVIAPYLWGWVADHSGRRLALIRSGSLFAVLCFAGVYMANDVLTMALVMLLFGFFWNAGLPQFEATTLYFLGPQSHRYSHIRLWGSIGFILTVLSLGPLLDRSGVTILPHILLALFLLIWLTTMGVPDRERDVQNSPRQSIVPVLKQPVVLVVLLVGFLMQLGFGPFYAFFSIFLQEHGYNKATVGTLWAIGVIAEIVVFLNMHRVLPKFSIRYLLLFCFAVTALRWVLVALYVEQLWVILLTQLGHAFSFGMYHAAMIHFIHRYFGGSLSGRGQAVYSSLSFGAGGAVGALIAGITWQSLGGATTYLLSAAVAVVGLLIVAAGLPEKS